MERERQPLPNGIAVWPVLTGQRFVHEDDPGRVALIGWRKVPAVDDANPHRVEVVFRDGQVLRGDLAIRRVLLLLDPELNERRGGEWLRRDAGCLANARHRLQRRANAVVESGARGIVFGDLDASNPG